MRKILTDLDGTIMDHKTIPTRKEWWLDKPKKFALEAIWKLHENNEIIIFTSRKPEEWKIIDFWLYIHGFPLLRITNVKEKADVYLDDRAIRFNNWMDISKLLC